MRGAIMRLMVAGVAMAVLAGCATVPSYSEYSTQQLRQELAKQKEQFTLRHQAINAQKQDYRDSVNNRPTVGTVYGAGAVGSLEVLGHALGARAASKKTEAIQLELIRRGEWCPGDI